MCHAVGVMLAMAWGPLGDLESQVGKTVGGSLCGAADVNWNR